MIDTYNLAQLLGAAYHKWLRLLRAPLTNKVKLGGAYLQAVDPEIIEDMEDKMEMMEFKNNTKKKQWIAAILLIIVAFVIGIVIGHFAIKKPESKSQDGQDHKPGVTVDKKAEFQKRQEEINDYHGSFQVSISEKELNNSLK